MNDREVAEAIRHDVVDANLAIYRDLFDRTQPSEATDSYWRQALTFYQELDQDDRRVLLRIIHQVMVDTTSNLLAILDGVTPLGGRPGDLTLLSEGERVDGDLQDRFLESIERDRK